MFVCAHGMQSFKTAISIARSLNEESDEAEINTLSCGAPIYSSPIHPIEADVFENYSHRVDAGDNVPRDEAHTAPNSNVDDREAVGNMDTSEQGYGSNISYIQALVSSGISHVPLYRFPPAESKSGVHTVHDYPTLYEGICINCGMRITSVPVFPVLNYDSKKRIYVLSRFATCSVACGKANIISTKSALMSERLAWYGQFCRDYFGIGLESIGTLPMTARKAVSPYGYLTDEQFRDKAKRVTAFVATPPIMFAKTWMVETSLHEKTQEQQKQNSIIMSLHASEEQQQNYQQNMRRIMSNKLSIRSIGNAEGSSKKPKKEKM